MPTANLHPLSSDQTQTSTDPDQLHELLTVHEVAALLKVSPSWVYEHTRSRGTTRAERLPHVRIGKYVRFQPAAIQAFLERKCQAK